MSYSVFRWYLLTNQGPGLASLGPILVMTSRPRRNGIIFVLLLLLGLLALLFSRCSRPKDEVTSPKQSSVTTGAAPALPTAKTLPADEVLTSATLQAPQEVPAGARFRVRWTGPGNPGDYVTIVPPTAAPAVYENYQEIRAGTDVELLAPMQVGTWELRYVTSRSKQVLGRAAIAVLPLRATLDAPTEARLGSGVSISWIGPGNPGDFITIVPAAAPDQQVGNYADLKPDLPALVNAPVDAGAAEIRYVSGQGRQVLARRPLLILGPEITLEGPREVRAGAIFRVEWRGTANKGDYITVVPKGTPDGQYRNYSDAAKGSSLELTAPIEAGPAELRYMSGTGARVLARRAIEVQPVTVSLDLPAEVVAGAAITVSWTGPKNTGDYLTVIPTATPDGQYGNYTDAAKGSPLTVTAPIRAGPAEVRYMSGQGAKVLGRRAVLIVPAVIMLRVPAQVAVNARFSVEWTGPNHRGDYLTMVISTAKDGVSLRPVLTSRGSPAVFQAGTEPGTYQIRYVSGQGNVVLARTDLEVR